VQQNPFFRPYRTRTQHHARAPWQPTTEAASGAHSQSPRAKPIRSAQHDPSQGRAGGSRGGQAPEWIVISDDDDDEEEEEEEEEPKKEDVQVKAEP
jgi:hypothetical protein